MTLTVTETVELTGLVQDTDETALVTNLTPELIKRWGEGNFSIDNIELAEPEEADFIKAVTIQNKKDLN